MAEEEANLPPRPPSFPRLVPGKLDIYRLVSFALVVFTIIFQIVVIYAPHQAYNDYGTLQTVDPIGFPFYITGGLIDLYMILAAIYVRRKQNKGDLHCRGYLPHPGFLLFIDICVMGGCLAWGGLSVAFGILGEDALYAVFAFGMIFVGVAHLKLMVDDCRYVHYRRISDQEKKDKRNRNVMMNDMSAQ